MLCSLHTLDTSSGSEASAKMSAVESTLGETPQCTVYPLSSSICDYPGSPGPLFIATYSTGTQPSRLQVSRLFLQDT